MAILKGSVLLVPAPIYFASLLGLLTLASGGQAQSGEQLPAVEPVTSAFDSLLGQAVHGDRVDYEWIAENPRALLNYSRQLASLNVDALTTRADSLAFFINAYNTNTILLVLSQYPGIESVLNPIEETGERGDFFQQRVRIGMADWTLDEIEHEVLRRRLGDARVHFAINCASLSCPPLRGQLFTSQGINDELDEVVRSYLGDVDRVRWSAGGDTLYVSELFGWFEEDFVAHRGSISGFVRSYVGAPGNAVSRPTVAFLPYDWSLNDFVGN